MSHDSTETGKETYQTPQQTVITRAISNLEQYIADGQSSEVLLDYQQNIFEDNLLYRHSGVVSQHPRNDIDFFTHQSRIRRGRQNDHMRLLSRRQRNRLKSGKTTQHDESGEKEDAIHEGRAQQ